VVLPNKSADEGADAIVSIPDLRDYSRINAELVQLLSAGRCRVRLAGAYGQRLLLLGLSGPWQAVVEIEGTVGPELAAGLDAPGLLVVCRGAVGDGAGSRLRSGRILILGSAGDAVGYTQAGGTIVVAGPAGHRAGLGQSDGTLILLGPVGRLAGERQTGGLLIAHADRIGPHSGFGRSGGNLLLLPAPGHAVPSADAANFQSYQRAMQEMAPWVEDAR
jgi:methylamine---glutamate N-methyltransferase subunit B